MTYITITIAQKCMSDKLFKYPKKIE